MFTKNKITKTVTAIFAFLLLNSCTEYKKESDWGKYDLKGRVQSYKEITYKAEQRFGIISKGERTQQFQSFYDKEMQFDQNGSLLVQNEYFSDGSLNTKTIFEYDSEKKLIGKHESHTDDRFDRKWTYNYDLSGNMIEEVRIDNNIFSPTGILTIKWTYQYDNKGNLVNKDFYKEGLLLNSMLYKYDNKGNLAEEKDYNSNDELYRSISFIYDQNGNLTEKKAFKGDGSLSWKRSYEYNKSGNLVQKIEYESNGSFDDVFIYTYDDSQNMIEENWQSYSEGKPHKKYTEKYSFDEYGNWFRKIKSINGAPTHIIEREIKYFADGSEIEY